MIPQGVAGELFVVATPIGNLEDITLRAVATLKRVDRVVAEDTRHTRKLLSHLAIVGKKIESLHEHTQRREIDALVDALRRGEALALVSDAGTPLVSDPGQQLVALSAQAGIRVTPVPGACAVLAALCASGFEGLDAFRFFGFLPREGPDRARAFSTLAATSESVVFFESPERCQATLTELASLTPHRRACVARELTKLHEEFRRGSLAELSEKSDWRGEITIALGPWDPSDRDGVDDAAIDRRIDEELAQGRHPRTLADLLAAFSGRTKREMYERIVRRKNEGL